MVLSDKEEAKKGICFSMSPSVDKAIAEEVKEGTFRNKSDFVERAVRFFLENNKRELHRIKVMSIHTFK